MESVYLVCNLINLNSINDLSNKLLNMKRDETKVCSIDNLHTDWRTTELAEEMIVDETPEQKYYLTFGQSHKHKVGDQVFDKDTVCVIRAKSHARAREIAFQAFGDKFFTSYDKFTWSNDMRYFPKGYVELLWM